MSTTAAFRAFVEEPNGTAITLDVPHARTRWLYPEDEARDMLSGSAPLFAGEGSLLEGVWPYVLRGETEWQTRRYLVTPPSLASRELLAHEQRDRVTADEAQIRKLEQLPPLIVRDVWGVVDMLADVIFGDEPDSATGWGSGYVHLPFVVPVGIANESGEILITTHPSVQRKAWRDLRKLTTLDAREVAKIYTRLGQTSLKAVTQSADVVMRAVVTLAIRLQRVVIWETNRVGYSLHPGSDVHAWAWHGSDIGGVAPACMTTLTGVGKTRAAVVSMGLTAQHFYHGQNVRSDRAADLILEF